MPQTVRTQAVDLLEKLVSIPSPSRYETRAAVYLAGWLNDHGFDARVDEAGNAVGVRGDGQREILLLGHIDTFPGDIPVRRQGDLLYGRGAVDAKGPLCAFAAAAAQVKPPAGWRVTVVGAVEEEAATSKGARHILSQRLDSPPAYCIIGEPSNWDRVTLGYKGRLLLDIDLTAAFSHSAGAQKLPAEQAVDLWRQVEQFCESYNRERQAASAFSRLEPSLRHIASRDEGAYGRVEMSLGFRLPLGLSPDRLEAHLRRLFDHLPPDVTARLHFSGGELAYKSDKSNPLVGGFLRSIRQAGGVPRFVVKTGTADMNVVGPHWPDTPMVAYGPGDSSLDHTPNEHINLTEYMKAIEVLQNTLRRLMGGQAEEATQ
ncbi:MAG: [LysW]-lysine hydrolase [Chloroflexi bacterium]|nr:MAG: [LysW]-lysine hydrolase [Chloroflexota bacterium]